MVRNRFGTGLAVSLGLLLAACQMPVAASGDTAREPAAAGTDAAPVSRAVAASPDGRTVFTLTADDGQPAYTVERDGAVLVGTSKLGLRFAAGEDLDTGLVIAGVSEHGHDETWALPWGERRMVRDHHREVLIELRDEDGDDRGYDLRVRVFDEGAAFRYEVRGDGPRAIVDEITEFSVAGDATAWWTPAGEFNRLEYTYRTTPVADIPRANTPLTLRTGGGTHVAIHEAALVDYAGMWLDQRRAGMLEADLAPRHDGVKARVEGDFKTPWRVIQIADDAAGLYNGSDIYLNLNAPNALGDVSYFEPGKYVGIWWGMHINAYTWGSGPKHGATTKNTKRYIDFAAEHGFNGVLVEGWNVGWDGDWFNNGELFSFTEPYPDYDFEALADYAAENGTKLIGHHETSGNIANYEAQLEDAMDLMAARSVSVIKTGYVADASDLKLRDEDGVARYTWHDSQERVVHDIRVLEAAHARGIAINAHEPARATGLRRTYPNAVSREGARGMEFNAWGTPPNTVEHQAILPFTRMLAGPFDFTPGIFDLMPNGPDDVNRVPSTLAKQLALYVTIYSPVQMVADLPENYAAHMDAFQFIKDVPADWEETIALQGEVGDHFVVARKDRNSSDWYIGGVTDEMARTVTVPLDFVESGQVYSAQIYRDGPGADWETNPYPVAISTLKVDGGSELRLPMAPGGGFAVRLVADGGAAATEMSQTPGETVVEMPSGARLVKVSGFGSDHVAAREMQVWLPAGYDESDRSYPVLYMHDGQNVFEDARAYKGVSWGLDGTLSRLIAEGAVEPAIVVALDNTWETRWHEYAPEAFIDGLPEDTRAAMVEAAGGAPFSDRYLSFLVDEVKPHIDQTYRTKPGREHTMVAGASMGGLISLYAVSEYPDVFSAAAGLSTHWPLFDPRTMTAEVATAAMIEALDAGGLDASRHRLWFDHGDQNLDAAYPPYQAAMDAYFRAAGFDETRMDSRYYPGTDHNEASWAARLADPLVFLLGTVE
ncbi:MAG: glycoside hydrolase family 97 catalytic domain-containing protein [Pseudomonadota bacterium]